MRHLHASILVGLLLIGCEPANKYTPRSPRQGGVKPTTPTGKEDTRKSSSPEASADLAWQDPVTGQLDPAVPIRFVTSASPDEWNKLPAFWNEGEKEVVIKVPLGLADPSERIPADNPPTVGKWKLGKMLFFEDKLLHDGDNSWSCAKCHDPAKGFTTDITTYYIAGRNPSTLFNVAFNDYQFWDGRVRSLEEVVQSKPEDERDQPSVVHPPHTWGGVVKRLRNWEKSKYLDEFRKVFGTEPTSDAVGKALATYMRTILVGNSTYDRAEQARRDRKGAVLELADFQKAMAGSKEEDVKQTFQGYQLFFNLAEHKANCVTCHRPRNFYDHSFHNIGVGESSHPGYEPGKEPGHFRFLPIGRKDRKMIGAFKTPTLRGLPRTGPYFHDGSQPDLTEVVWFHVRGGRPNSFLDPEMRDTGGKGGLALTEEEVHAVVKFLDQLDGSAVDGKVTDSGK